MVARRSISLLLAFLTLTVVMLVNAGGALAIEKGNLDQCANGPLTTPVQCVTTNWENGNLNASKAHYLEGQSVPYRIGLTDLNVGTSYTVRVEWDTTQGGDHALDYLTSFDRTETTANACTGILTVAQCAAAPTTAAIPIDPNVTKGQDQTLGNADDIVQVPGQQFKMWGGNLTGTAPNYVLSGTYAGNSATSIDIQFTATGSTAVLAWGGHIASRQDWGAGNSAIAISGSPYHMRLLTLIPPDQGGNQDRSLSTDAVIFPATFNVIKAATPEGSTSFPFTSNFTTSTFNGSFSLVDNGTSTNTKTVSDILTFGTSKSVTEGLVTDWTLDSIACSQINGSTQAVTNFAGNVGTRTAAATINEGDTVTCTFANSRDKGSLEVRKQLSPTTDSGLFNLFIKQGATTIDSQADAGHNGTTGANTVDTGTYQVSETAGTGTNLSDYSAALSCSDQNGSVSSTGGNVTVAKGRNVVCTFTNTRETGSIELRKQLSPSGDPGKFNLAITQGANTIDTEADAGHNGTTGANAVSTGTYHVAETGGTGTTLNDYSAALSCSDQNGTVASTGGNVSVADGRTVVCTFTNTRKTGTLEVRKSLSPTGDPGVFDLFVKQGANTIDSASNQTHNGTTGANTVSTGTYQVSEAAGTNTDLNDYSASLSCSDQNGTVSSTGGNVAVGDGQNVVCTFTNTRETGTIELRKSLSPTDDPGLFDLTIEHGATLVDSATDQTHNGTTGANTVNTGTYDVSEAAGSNTDLDDYQSSLACSDQDGTVSSTGGSVAVGDGKNVVCTFTNTRETGTIQVRKELSPTDDPGLFNLFVKQGATTVESAANQGHNGSTSVKTVNTGTYQVSETGGTATDLDDYQAALECEDEDGTVSSTGGSVAVGDGKDVVCTFTNTRETGTIELRKELSPTDDPGVFDLTIKQGATTVDSADDAGHNDSTGPNTVNTGSYQVSEAGGTDTDLDDYQAALECEDEDGTVASTGGNVAVADGKDVVCTFTNTRETGTIELRKELSPTDDPGLFDLAIKQGANTIDSKDDATHDDTTGPNTVNTGTYQVSEAGGTDTDLDDYDAALACEDEDGTVDSTGGSVAVGDGKDVVCTFTNTRETGTIELRKQLSPTDDPGVFDLTIKHGATTVDTADDAGHNDSTGANTVNTGTYQVSEAAGTDTDLDDYQAALSCSDQDGTVDSTGGSVAVRDGKAVVCTFTNTRETGTIELRKELSPTDDPGVFDLTIKQGATTVDTADDAGHDDSTGSNTVNTGTYHVSEAGGTDTDLDDYQAALECEDEDGVVSSTGGDVAVRHGKDVVCTFTNTRETGTIELRKELSPTDDPGVFDLAIKHGATTVDTADDAGHDDSTGANTVNTGTYQVSEAAGTDTDLDDYQAALECEDETGTISSTGGNVAVGDGRTVVCTFTNTRETGTIELRKELSPTDDPGVFDLKIEHGTDVVDTEDDAGHNDSTGANTVNTGTYHVSEAAGTDTDLDDYQAALECEDEDGTVASTGGDVVVRHGKDVVCTFTNTRETGSIELRKALSPTDDPGLFDLTIKQGATTIDSKDDATHNGTTGANAVNTGTYQVSEAAGTDTDLDDYQAALACSDEDGAVDATGGNVAVRDGKAVVCTFTNTRETGTIELRKALSPDTDPGIFDLKIEHGATVVDSKVDAGDGDSTDANTVNTGTYHVSEAGGTDTDLDDYQASLECEDEDGTVTSTGGDVAVRHGKDVVCTFTNTRETGTIELRKSLSPDTDPGVFDLKIEHGATVVDTEDDAGDGDSTDANTVNTGTYHVSEAGGTDTDLDDYQASLACSDQDGAVTSTGGDVAVRHGKTVVCTFTNTRETGTIELRKTLSPDTDPGLFDLTIKQGATAVDSKADAGDGDTTGSNTVNTGTYQVSEAGGTDTDLDDYQAALECEDDTGTIDSTDGNVAVRHGKDVVCTFTNTRETGTITLRKELSPTDDPGLFDLTIKHGADVVDTEDDAGHGDSTGANTVNTGTYEVSEAAGTNTDLGDYQAVLECEDETGTISSTGGSVAVADGRNVVCTFTNSRETGTIELRKTLSPDTDPGVFDLTIKHGATTVDSKDDAGDGDSTGPNTVNTGTYEVSEAGGTGTDLDDYQASLSCTDEDGAVTSTGGSVAVRDGKNVVCTFTNTRETGTIELRKELSPSDDPGVFDLAIKQGANTVDTADDAGHNDSTGANTVNTGTYQVSEAGGTDTDLDDYQAALECEDEDGIVSSTGGNVAVRHGKSVVCTFTNTRETGTIELRKELSPSDDPGVFDLTIKQGSTTIDTEDDASHNDSTGANTVNTGTYEVSEAAGTDTDLDDYHAALECEDEDGTVDSTGGDVVVRHGKDVVCTFTNTRETGTIELRKSLSPSDDPGLFDLTIKQGSTTIDTEDDAGHNDSTGANTVNTGAYEVSEAAGTDTDLDDYQAALSCSDQDGSVDSTGGNVAVRDGKAVVCTFTNTRETGSIELRKELSPDDDPGVFNLFIKQGSTVVDSATDQGHGATTGANTVNTGTYQVSEAGGTNTNLDDYGASLSCTDEDGAVASDANGNVVVRYGKHVVCTFVNTRETGTIELRKELSPSDDPGKFDLAIKQAANTIDSKDDAGHGDSTGANTVNTGTYQVSEADGTGTDLDDYHAALECEDQDGTVTSTGGNVAVADGKDVVCTFTNTRETGTIELRKELSPTNDPGLFDLTIKQSGNTVDSAANQTHNGTTGTNTVNTGTYQLSEAAGNGTDLDDYNSSLACVDEEGPVESGDDVVDVGDGQNVVCTFTNTRKTGKLEVKKALSPANDAGRFDLKIDGGTQKANAADGDSTGEKTVNTGTHTVSEGQGSSGSLSDYQKSITCIDTEGRNQSVAATTGDSGGPLNVPVDEGSDIVCTITNVRETGTIELRKALKPSSDPGVFDLTIKLGSTTVAVKKDAGDGGTTGQQTVNTGTYDVSEAAGTNTDASNYASSLECSDQSGPVSSTGGSVTIGHGNSVVCTFNNTRLDPAIAIDKTGPATATAGELVEFTMFITNPGDQPLTGVDVNDNRCIAKPALQAKNRGAGPDPTPDTLDPGDSWVYTCSGQTQSGQTSFENTATVTATDGRHQVSANDTHTVPLSQLVVAGERVTPGSARLGSKTGCQAKPFTVRVKGKSIVKVDFAIDGKKRKSVLKPDSSGRWNYKVDPRKFKPGRHKLTAKATFDPDSGTRAKTMTVKFSRCVRAAQAPAFTG